MDRYIPAAAFAVALLAVAFAARDAHAATPCEQLTALALPHATITSAESVAAGDFTPPGGAPLTGLPAFCRVAGEATPTSDSRIAFEVWIPSAEAWNGKYLQVGTIGYGGAFQYGAMGLTLKRGYAVASTDAGHKAALGVDASFALGHPEKIIDFGYRAAKETTDKAKAILRAHAGRGPRYSYFVGGSNGGREALMAAQRYPGDFDGLISEGPALYWTHLAAAWVWTEQALNSDPASFFGAAKQPALQAAVNAACDREDGIADGIVGDPRECDFNPAVLRCTGAETDGCLTAPQVTALRKIMAGPRNPRTGRRIFPGFEVGAIGYPLWRVYITGPAAPPFFNVSGHTLFGNSFFANMVLDVGDAAFDFRTVDFDSHIALADNKRVGSEALGTVINAVDPDLSAFKARGGKMIMFHGWEDPVVPPRAVIQYYEDVVGAQSSKKKDALRKTREFFRFFLLPGAMHFVDGPGPGAVGSPWGLPASADDRMHDVIRALEAWVEDGIAPRQLIATQYAGGNPAAGIVRKRPACPYPQVARWTGKGSTDEAANFRCVEGEREDD